MRTMRRYGPLLLLLTLAFTPSFGNEPEEFVRYVDKQGSYSIELPKSWTVRLFEDDIMAAKRDRDGKLVESGSINVEKLETEMSEDQYVQRQLPLMRKALADFKFYDEDSITIHGMTFRRVVYAHRMGGREVKVILYLTIRDRKAYSLQFATGVNEFDKNRARYEKIVQSFKSP